LATGISRPDAQIHHTVTRVFSCITFILTFPNTGQTWTHTHSNKIMWELTGINQPTSVL